jgi:hypothetical protein
LGHRWPNSGFYGLKAYAISGTLKYQSMQSDAVHYWVALSRVATPCRDVLSVSRSDSCVFLSTSVTGCLGLQPPETIDVSPNYHLTGRVNCWKGWRLSLRWELAVKLAVGLRWLRILSNWGFSWNLCVLQPGYQLGVSSGVSRQPGYQLSVSSGVSRQPGYELSVSSGVSRQPGYELSVSSGVSRQPGYQLNVSSGVPRNFFWSGGGFAPGIFSGFQQIQLRTEGR